MFQPLSLTSNSSPNRKNHAPRPFAGSLEIPAAPTRLIASRAAEDEALLREEEDDDEEESEEEESEEESDSDEAPVELTPAQAARVLAMEQL
jgi:hypothetical protein